METIQFSIAGQNYSDWYTITGPKENGMYQISRQGNGDNSQYEADETAVQNLKDCATLETI